MAQADDMVLYYQNLLILQYRGKRKARADIDAVVRPLQVDGLPLLVRDAYGIDTAVGVQLDVLGKYVGVKRLVKTFSGSISLDDSDFRQLIKMKIFRNNSSGSLDDIDRLIQIFFPTALRAFDYANMHMSYYFDAAAGSQQLAEAFVVLGLLPKPMGVQLATLVYATNLTKVFSFRTTETIGTNVSGFSRSDTGFVPGSHWLSTADGIIL